MTKYPLNCPFHINLMDIIELAGCITGLNPKKNFHLGRKRSYTTKRRNGCIVIKTDFPKRTNKG